MILLLLMVLALVLVNLIVGSVPIGASDVVGILLGNETVDEVYRQIVMQTRLPQIYTAVFCGAGLAVAGLEMQTLFHNPLAGPSVLGISSAASLGVALMVLLSNLLGVGMATRFGWMGNASLALAAVMGALCAMSVMVLLSMHSVDNPTLLIVGVLMGYIASAVVGVLKYFASADEVHSFVIWGLGSFSRVSGGQVGVFAALMSVLVIASMFLAKSLNMLLMGESYARNLGLDIRRARLLIIVSAGVITAFCTAYCGPIMFLGLAVPHICRGLFSTADHRVLLPAVTLCGAALALLCNVIARLPGMEGALPINSVTAIVGAPIALRVILRKKKQI